MSINLRVIGQLNNNHFSNLIIPNILSLRRHASHNTNYIYNLIHQLTPTILNINIQLKLIIENNTHQPSTRNHEYEHKSQQYSPMTNQDQVNHMIHTMSTVSYYETQFYKDAMLSGRIHSEEQQRNYKFDILVLHQAWIRTSGSSVS
jgi:hypothetical protein